MDQKDNLADLIARVHPEHQEMYGNFRYVFTEAAFFNRKFVIVKTQGRTGQGPNPPVILGSVRVTAYSCDEQRGAQVTLMDEASSHTLRVGYVPVKLFRYPIFISVPIYQGVKWEAREARDGSYDRALVFGLCFKQKSDVKWYNKEEAAILTLNEYREHFADTVTRF